MAFSIRVRNVYELVFLYFCFNRIAHWTLNFRYSVWVKRYIIIKSLICEVTVWKRSLHWKNEWAAQCLTCPKLKRNQSPKLSWNRLQSHNQNRIQRKFIFNEFIVPFPLKTFNNPIIVKLTLFYPTTPLHFVIPNNNNI